MIIDILKGFLIGIFASIPLGPIAILVIQKSLSYGHKTGFMAGLGACLVDTLFAIVAIFALALVEGFINTHETVIMIAGGLIILLLGVAMAFKDPFRKVQAESSGGAYSLKAFLQAFAMGISNPGAILVILALFAFFQVELEPNDFRVAPLLLSLSLGSALYWFSFSWVFSHLRRNFKLSTILWINRISGVILIIIGVVITADGLIKIIFR